MTREEIENLVFRLLDAPSRFVAETSDHAGLRRRKTEHDASAALRALVARAEAAEEREEATRAANVDTKMHWDVLKADYDAVCVRAEAVEAERDNLLRILRDGDAGAAAVFEGYVQEHQRWSEWVGAAEARAANLLADIEFARAQQYLAETERDEARRQLIGEMKLLDSAEFRECRASLLAAEARVKELEGERDGDADADKWNARYISLRIEYNALVASHEAEVRKLREALTKLIEDIDTRADAYRNSPQEAVRKLYKNIPLSDGVLCAARDALSPAPDSGETLTPVQQSIRDGTFGVRSATDEERAARENTGGEND